MNNEYFYDEKVIYNLTQSMNNELKKKRFVHSLGVSITAASLAMKYGEDVYKAQIAGILHDCAKCYSESELYKLCLKEKINLSADDNEHGFALHAKYGAYLAKSKYGIDDEYILDAIYCHTTGRKNMTLLDKIIYIADYIEPSRNTANNLMYLRKLAFDSDNINIPVCKIMENTLNYLKESNAYIDSTTLEIYEYYKSAI